jgi:hypothetical protein
MGKKNVYIVYDNDPAGVAGSAMVAGAIRDWAKSVEIHEWKDRDLHFDVGDLIINGGNLHEEFGRKG